MATPHAPSCRKHSWILSVVTTLLVLALASVADAAFRHPGILVDQADLDRTRAKLADSASPWKENWRQFVKDPNAQWWHGPVGKPTTGGTDGTRQRAQMDADAAFLNALRWHMTGDTLFGWNAVRNLSVWADSIDTVVTGELFMLPIMRFMQAAELTRSYPGWDSAGIARFKKVAREYFYPACKGFLGWPGSWPSWDGPANASILYIAVFLDDTAMFREAIDYYRSGPGGGSLPNTVVSASGQMFEMGRDQPHAEIAHNVAAEISRTAWLQGVDLFAERDNRLLAGFEYFNRFNLGHLVDWEPLDDVPGGKRFFHPAYRDENRVALFSGNDLVYNHYVVEKGLSAPYTKAMINLRDLKSPTNSSYGALLFTRDEATSPYVRLPSPDAPTDLQAIPGLGQIRLCWTPPPGDIVAGSIIQRADAPSGPFQRLGTWTYNTSRAFVDTTARPGQLYHYRVAVLNSTDTSQFSAPASASTLPQDSTTPQGWIHTDIGPVAKAGRILTATGDSVGRAFALWGSGASFHKDVDAHGFVYQRIEGDFTLTARLHRVDQPRKVGLMMRASLDGRSLAVSVGQHDDNLRKNWMAWRETPGAALRWTGGNSHTWIPGWLRLQRRGSEFTGYQSHDGIRWFAVDTVVSPFPDSSYLAGLFVHAASTDSNFLPGAWFDQVSLVPGAPSGTPAKHLATSRFVLRGRTLTATPRDDSPALLEIHTLAGRRLLSRRINGPQALDLHALPPGLLHVSLRDDAGSQSRTFVLP